MKKNSLVTRVALSIGLTLIAFSLILFFVARTFLSDQLAKRDREIIHQEIQEYAATLQSGVKAVAARYAEEVRLAEQLALYLRVIAPDGRTELEEAHESYDKYNLQSLYDGTAKATNGWYQIERLDGEESLLDVFEIQSTNGLRLQLGMNSRFRDELLERFTEIFLQFASIALLLSSIAGILIARTTLKPLLKFRDSISNIKASDKQSLNWDEVEYSGYHEIQELSVAFNSLRQRIQMIISSMKDGLDMVAHETKSPLTRLRMKLERSLLSGSEVEKNESIADALEETDRVTGIINVILQVAESNGEFVSNSLTTFRASEVLAKVVSLYEDTAVQKECSLAMEEVKEDPVVTADFERIVQAISNLVDNAIKFTPAGGRITLSVNRKDKYVSFDVTDTGQGISEEEQPFIWERLYRGSISKNISGLGLGLSLVLAIARSHKGKVELQSTPGVGSTFRFLLPGH